MGALRIYLIGLACTGVLSASVAYYFFSRRKSPEERERERRIYLSSVGRITDGTVIDIRDFGTNGHGPSQFVIYQYDVAGVSYEASQEVTHLQQQVDIRTCKLGVPASVKYDPHNPGNSIVVAETWKGLR